MTVQPIGAAGAALYFTSSDLALRGLTPGGLTLGQALDLVGRALDRAVRVRQVEVFPDGEGVMLFAQLEPGAALRPVPARPRRRGRVRRYPT